MGDGKFLVELSICFYRGDLFGSFFEILTLGRGAFSRYLYRIYFLSRDREIFMKLTARNLTFRGGSRGGVLTYFHFFSLIFYMGE